MAHLVGYKWESARAEAGEVGEFVVLGSLSMFRTLTFYPECTGKLLKNFERGVT